MFFCDHSTKYWKSSTSKYLCLRFQHKETKHPLLPLALIAQCPQLACTLMPLICLLFSADRSRLFSHEQCALWCGVSLRYLKCTLVCEYQSRLQINQVFVFVTLLNVWKRQTHSTQAAVSMKWLYHHPVLKALCCKAWSSFQ